MSNVTRHFGRRLSLAHTLAIAAGLTAVAPAIAQTDRINDTQTGWWFWYGATAAFIDAEIANGRRPFNITPTGGNYDVVLASNSGEYAGSGVDVLHNLTAAQISAQLAGRRIIDLEVTNTLSGTFSAVVVNNSGNFAATGWQWATGLTYQQMIDWRTNNGLRPIDVDQYSTLGGTRYSIVAVPNSGINFQSGWWWYFGVTEAEVNTAISTNGARIVDIEVTGNNPTTFNVIMVSENPGGQWWYFGQTAAQVEEKINQTGGRLSCLSRYTNANGDTRFVIALVDNANAKTRRVRSLVDNALDSGTFGFKVQQVGGSVLGGLNTEFAFEPASMLKILHGTYAMDQIAAGNDTLTESILIRDTCNNNECPDPAQPCNSANEQLQQAIREMLEQSDNNRTMEIELKYGRTNLNNYAAALGLTNTDINHRLGCLCGNPFNTFSATDACNLYELIADGSLFSQTWQDTLYTLMNDKESQGWGVCPNLSAIINDEAASTNLTSSEIADFRDQVNFASKGGSYTCGTTYYRTEGGWAKIPFKALFAGNYIVLPREYTVASFVHGSNDNTGASIAYVADEELLREEVREALESWDVACSTPVINNNPDNVSNAPANSNVQFQVGLAIGAGSRTYQWQKQNPANNTWFNLANAANIYSGVATNTLTVITVNESDEGRFRCVVSSICGSDTSANATLTVAPIGPTCDDIDFNNDGSSFDPQDVDAFLSVFSEGPCIPANANCQDVDFNNDGSLFDPCDIDSFLLVFSEGPCTLCGQ
jgi:hypothetical protein